MSIAVQNQDNREHDIFDSGDYLQYHGGMVATVRALTGRHPKAYVGDSSDPGRSRVRELADEARRVFRTRVVSPKWVQSMQRHGYKGAFEMVATVDYLFGYDATAQVADGYTHARFGGMPDHGDLGNTSGHDNCGCGITNTDTAKAC
jgi:cobaltochelatase CobN